MKIIIVEDERVTRDGLERLLLQIEGVEVVAKCVSAREGYEKIRNISPDVVITDIVMNGESGLDMVDRCRNNGVCCEFVLLSGHSEFEYARRALRLNVFDYLNKPLDFTRMDTVIKRLKSKISNEYKSIDRMVDYYSGNVPKENPEAPDILNETELYVVAVNIYNRNTLKNDISLAQTSSEITVKSLKNYCRTIIRNGILYEVVSGREDKEKFISLLLSHIKSRSLKIGIDIHVGISRRFEEISAIGAKMTEALAAAQDCAFSGMSIGDATILSYQILTNPDPLYLREFLKIRDRLQIQDEREVCEATFSVVDSLSDIMPPYVLFSFLRRCVHEIGWNTGEDEGATISDDVDARIDTSPTREALRIRFAEIVSQKVENSLNDSKPKTGEDFARVIRYIRLHYSDKIHAADIAKMFYIDPAYFSKRFKKEMGRNYNDYVTELRVNKARCLLQSGAYSISELAQMVGYQSARHFSKVFKDHTGHYPSDIRKR